MVISAGEIVLGEIDLVAKAACGILKLYMIAIERFNRRGEVD